MIRALLIAFSLVASLVWSAPAKAQSINCSATMSDIPFGTVSLRSGSINQTSGVLDISCTGVGTVGVCVTIGPGSGGSGISPRLMRRSDNAPLSFQLRPGGNGPSGGVWDRVFVQVPTTLGSGSVSVAVFADITSSGVGTGIGSYASTFSGDPDISMEINVTSCNDTGPQRSIDPFTVSAQVAASCEVDAGLLDFGTLGAGTTGPVDASTTFLIRCTDTTPYTVRLDNGTGAGATGPTDRRMTGASAQLRYGLYQNASLTTPWGNGAGEGISTVGTGSDQGMTVFGRIFAGQPLIAGSYSDSVLITVEY